MGGLGLVNILLFLLGNYGIFHAQYFAKGIPAGESR